MIDKALRHVPTFEELVGILENDKTKIKLPHRTALHFFDSPLYQKVVDAENSLDQHETKVHHHHMHEREVVQTAAATGVSAAEVRTIMKEFQPAQQPAQQRQQALRYSTESSSGSHKDPGAKRYFRVGK